jgi:hypothetical protein
MRPDYSILDASPPDWVRIAFDGAFQGRAVRWEATVLTLRAAEHRSGAPQRRRFIDVHSVEAGRGQVTVGLDVPAVDPPTLLKTVVMLRQWKRLGPGRHEFGPAVREPPAGSGPHRGPLPDGGDGV